MRRLALLWPLALAACVPAAPEPTPAPTPTPVATRAPVQASPPAPTAFANWMDAPATPGDWHYRAASGQQVAAFRSPAGGDIASLACSGGQIVLTVFANAPRAGAITIRTESTTRAVAASGSASAVTASFARGDALLDAMAFSKGRFALEVAGGPQLFLPAYPEVSRVIEDCRG